MTKRAMFIGRWQPFHKGHEWLIRQKLDKGVPVLIAVRDIEPDEKNPFTTHETVAMILQAFTQEDDIMIMPIPDIESVNYGRGVGYEINEYKPPEDVKRVSATQIRESIKQGDDAWKSSVAPRVADWLEEYYARDKEENDS